MAHVGVSQADVPELIERLLVIKNHRKPESATPPPGGDDATLSE